MKKYDVSLNFVTSDFIDDYNILPIFKDSQYNEYLSSDYTIDSEKLWRVASEPDTDGSILSQVKSICSLISTDIMDNLNDLIKKIYFDIIVYYDTVDCSANFSSDSLRLITAVHPKIEILITTYPTDFE